MGNTYTRKTPRPVHYDVADTDDLYVTRMPSSARRYRSRDTLDDPMVQRATTIQRRRSSITTQSPHGMVTNTIVPARTRTEPLPTSHKHTKQTTMFVVLVGMVVTILILLVVNALQPRIQAFQDYMHYGNPPTSQLDAVVGHGDSPTNRTHFIFLNLHGKVQVIEIPGGDTTRIRAFVGPTLFGNGADTAPVTGEIHNDNGHLNLYIYVQGQRIIFINDGTTFHQQ